MTIEKYEKLNELAIYRDLTAVAMLTCLFLTPALIFNQSRKLLKLEISGIIGIDLIVTGLSLGSDKRYQLESKKLENESLRLRNEQLELSRKLELNQSPVSCLDCQYLFGQYGVHCAIVPDVRDVLIDCKDKAVKSRSNGQA